MTRKYRRKRYSRKHRYTRAKRGGDVFGLGGFATKLKKDVEESGEATREATSAVKSVKAGMGKLVEAKNIFANAATSLKKAHEHVKKMFGTQKAKPIESAQTATKKLQENTDKMAIQATATTAAVKHAKENMPPRRPGAAPGAFPGPVPGAIPSTNLSSGGSRLRYKRRHSKRRRHKKSKHTKKHR